MAERAAWFSIAVNVVLTLLNLVTLRATDGVVQRYVFGDAGVEARVTPATTLTEAVAALAEEG